MTLITMLWTYVAFGGWLWLGRLTILYYLSIYVRLAGVGFRSAYLTVGLRVRKKVDVETMVFGARASATPIVRILLYSESYSRFVF